MSTDRRVCPDCGRVFETGLRFCPDDGTQLVDAGGTDDASGGQHREHHHRYSRHHRDSSAPDPVVDLRPSGVDEELLARDYDVRLWEWLGEGWDLFRADALLYVGFFLVYSITLVVPPLDIAIGIISPILMAGPILVALRRRHGRDSEFRHLFLGFRYWVHLLAGGLLVGLFVAIGLAFFILPGVYLMVSYFFVLELIADRRMHFWDAMETSRKMVSKNWFDLLLLVIILAVLNLLGGLALLIGLLVTMPLVFTVSVAAYAGIFGLAEEPWYLEE